jgi:hypothetical protein
MLTPFFGSELRQRTERFANLTAYVDRMMPQYYPEFAWAPLEQVVSVCIARTQLVLGLGEGRFEHVADRLPGTAVELNQPQVFDRPKIPRSGVDFDSG